MLQALDILKVAHRNTIEPSMNLLHMKEQHIPGSIQYVVRRYYAQQQWKSDDTGMLVYHYSAKAPEENFLELRYCISGNKYCFEKGIILNRLNLKVKSLETRFLEITGNQSDR